MFYYWLHQPTLTPKDHLRFLNLHKHLFDTCSEITFFWMVCLSLMAQYPSLDWCWKLPLKRSWSSTKISKVGVLEIETDSETGSKGVWSPCSAFVLLPWFFITDFCCKGISSLLKSIEVISPFCKDQGSRRLCAWISLWVSIKDVFVLKTCCWDSK